MKLQTEILSIIADITRDIDINEDATSQKIQDMGMDSITFVKMVIAIEEKYDIEFDYEMLIDSSFSTLQSMIAYVERKIGEKKLV